MAEKKTKKSKEKPELWIIETCGDNFQNLGIFESEQKAHEELYDFVREYWNNVSEEGVGEEDEKNLPLIQGYPSLKQMKLTINMYYRLNDDESANIKHCALNQWT